MSKPKQKRSPRFSPVMVAAGIVLVAALLGFGGYKLYQNHNGSKPATIQTPDGKKVELNPATTQEQQQTEDHKQEIVKQNSQNDAASNNSSAQRSSTVIISSATSSGVRAYVNGVFEENGTCTATATQGSRAYTKTSTGFENVSYTQCAPLDWDTPLGSGSWNISVTYKSAATESNKSMTIEVQ